MTVMVQSSTVFLHVRRVKMQFLCHLAPVVVGADIGSSTALTLYIEQ